MLIHLSIYLSFNCSVVGWLIDCLVGIISRSLLPSFHHSFLPSCIISLFASSNPSLICFRRSHSIIFLFHLSFLPFFLSFFLSFFLPSFRSFFLSFFLPSFLPSFVISFNFLIYCKTWVSKGWYNVQAIME